MPRAQVFGGLRGPAQVVFPEAAKETALRIGLTGTAEIYANTAGLDATGSPMAPSWHKVAGPVRSRIDYASVEQSDKNFGDRVDERTSHIITLDADIELTSDHQIHTEGKVWVVTAVLERTDKAVTRAEVMVAP